MGHLIPNYTLYFMLNIFHILLTIKSLFQFLFLIFFLNHEIDSGKLRQTKT